MLDKKNWKDEHLKKLHKENYDWCPFCVAREKGKNEVGENIGINVSEAIKSKDVGPGQGEKKTTNTSS